MATQRRRRRGTTAQHASFTGALAELSIDTDKFTAVVHDNSTAGGFPLAREDMSNVDPAHVAALLNWFTPQMFGAVANGIAEDHEAINDALSGGNKFVYFPEGEYLVKDFLRLWKNTRLVMHPNCVIVSDTSQDDARSGLTFLNGEYGNDTYATGYDGDGNIWISGGKITFAGHDTGYRAQAFALSHGDGIYIDHVHIDGWRNAHAMDVAGCRNVHITKCKFTNQIIDEGFTNREAIQTDHCGGGRFPHFGATDDTPTRDMWVRECLFDTIQVAIGDHGSAVVEYENINFLDNIIRNAFERGISARRWYNSRVHGNHIDTVGGRGIHLQECEDMPVTENTVIDSGLTTDTNSGGIFLHSSKRCIVDKTNRVYNRGATNYREAVEIGTSGDPSEDCVVETDRMDDGSTRRVTNSGIRTKVNGVTHFEIPGDDVAIFPITSQARQGILVVNLHSNATYRVRGFFWISYPSETIDEIAATTGANFELSAGVHTGTTGTDNRVTLAVASDGNVYLENRRSGNIRGDLSFIGS